jgi:hypothetical protein
MKLNRTFDTIAPLVCGGSNRFGPSDCGPT